MAKKIKAVSARVQSQRVEHDCYFIVQVGYYETSAVTGAGVAEVLQAGLETNLCEV